MTATFSRVGFVSFCLLLGSSFGGGMDVASSMEGNVGHHYDNLDSLKEDVRWSSKWWNVTAGAKSFAVCWQELPSWGQGRQSVHAWRKNADGSFALVWSYRTVGIGTVEVELDEVKGIVSVKAIANTDLQGSVIAVADLRATAG
jgi:hypothetical protein